jgi:hypothetical protein
MPRRPKKIHRSRPLIGGYLERISTEAFSQFPEALTSLVGKRHGVYALYKGERLYYCGLATNIRARINHHLRDRHAGKWDRFSLYLIHKADHIKELESLILRITCPKGNKMRGRLKRADDLGRELRKRAIAAFADWFGDVMGKGPRKAKSPLTSGRKAAATRRKRKIAVVGGEFELPPLAPYAGRGFMIRGWYKGKVHHAIVRKSGKVKYDGVLYNSPSLAAIAAAGKAPQNGWWFWHYLSNGKWLRLRELRRKA